MKTIDSVLLVADLAPGWKEAVETADELRRCFGTRVQPIHVVPPSLDGVLDDRALRREIDARINAILRERDTPTDAFSRTVIETGPRFEMILDEAETRDVNAIVIGAGTGGERESTHVSKTTARIARHSRRPVWVTKPGAPPRPRSILCPVDMSGSSRRALRNAIRLTETLEAELTVLHVVRPLSSMHPAAAAHADRERWDASHLERRRHDFHEFVDRFDFEGADWWPSVRSGEVLEQIVAAVAEHGYELIVMGTVGHNALTRLSIGSATEGVLRELPCSVIAVRDEHLVRDRVPNDLETVWQLCKAGRALLTEGRADEARVSFERAIAVNPFQVEAWEGLADAQDALGSAAEADRNRETARQIANQACDRPEDDEISNRGRSE